jgi:hypothetical protein
MQNHVILSSDIISTLLQVVYLVDLISIYDKQRIEKKNTLTVFVNNEIRAYNYSN